MLAKRMRVISSSSSIAIWSSRTTHHQSRVISTTATGRHDRDRIRPAPGSHRPAQPVTWGIAPGARSPCLLQGDCKGNTRDVAAMSIPGMMPAMPVPMDVLQNAIPALQGFAMAFLDGIRNFFMANSSVLGASAAVSFKLFVLILSIGWMVSTGRLPESTAPVLSKVGFNLIIPCMLMSKVAFTLTNEASWALAGVPLAAFLQVLAGAIIGRLASLFVLGDYSDKVRILGYHPRDPPAAAAAIAASTAAAMSLPQVAPQLIPKAKEPPQGLKQLVQLSCAFGNSLTLPLVFLFAVLPEAVANESITYVALFLAGWSPCLWSIGYEIMGSACAPPAQTSKAAVAGSGSTGGTLLDVVSPRGAVTPQVFGNEQPNNLKTVQKEKKAPEAAEGDDQKMTIDISWSSSGDSTDSSFSSESLQDDNAKPDRNQSQLESKFHEIRRQAAALWVRFVNPPIAGIIAGLFIGLSPVGIYLMSPFSPELSATIASYSLELQLMVHMGRSAMEVVAMLGGATLAVQAVVLAASMRPPKEEVSDNAGPRQATDASTSDLATSSSALAMKTNGKSRAKQILRLLFPTDPLEQRYLVAVLVARMLLMPTVGVVIVVTMSSMGLLPKDPICLFVILLQSAMPTAQNLVLLLQLRDETQPLASGLALLLLRSYMLSVIPLALWITLFMKVAQLSP